MINILEKIFNLPSLIILNIAIIISTELVGNGRFFYDTGLIHAIAIMFILLAGSRIYVHYHSYDPVLERLVHFSLAALAVFSMSHFVEFFSYSFSELSEDVIFANVGNFYIVSLLLIILGAESFIKAHDQKKRPWLFIFLNLFIFIQALVIFLFLTKDDIISLEPDSPALYIYVAIILVLAILGIFKLTKIARLVSIAKKFSYYLIATIILVALSAIQNIGYEVLEESFHMPDHQIIYVSHFAFYIGLSLMFLAFVQLNKLPGIYAELDKAKKKLGNKKKINR